MSKKLGQLKYHPQHTNPNIAQRDSLCYQADLYTQKAIIEQAQIKLSLIDAHKESYYHLIVENIQLKKKLQELEKGSKDETGTNDTQSTGTVQESESAEVHSDSAE